MLRADVRITSLAVGGISSQRIAMPLVPRRLRNEINSAAFLGGLSTNELHTPRRREFNALGLKL